MLAQSLRDTQRNVRYFISVIESFTHAKMPRDTAELTDGGDKSPTITAMPQRSSFWSLYTSPVLIGGGWQEAGDHDASFA